MIQTNSGLIIPGNEMSSSEEVSGAGRLQESLQGTTKRIPDSFGEV